MPAVFAPTPGEYRVGYVFEWYILVAFQVMTKFNVMKCDEIWRILVKMGKILFTWQPCRQDAYLPWARALENMTRFCQELHKVHKDDGGRRRWNAGGNFRGRAQAQRRRNNCLL